MKTAIAILGLIAAVGFAQDILPGTNPAAPGVPPPRRPLAISTTTSRPTTLPFTLGYDTTRITKPLLPDGRPDYLAVINETASKGVTRDNNMAVVLIQVVDQKNFISKAVKDKFLAILDIPQLEGNVCFKLVETSPDYDKALAGPWKSKDYPALVDWLKENDIPLAAIRGATVRPRWYTPLITDEEGSPLYQTLLPTVGQIRAISSALIIRANLAAGEGRLEDATEDLLAARQLGILLGQAPTLIENLVSLKTSSAADRAIADYAAAGAFSVWQARKLIDNLVAGPLPQPADTIDHGERFGSLDIIMWTATADPQEVVQFLTEGVVDLRGPNQFLRDSVRRDFTSVRNKLDYDAILRRANQHYDDLVAAMRKPSFAQRLGAVQVVQGQFVKFMDRLTTQPASTSPTDRKGFYLLYLLPELGRCQVVADLAMVQRDLAVVALGLCAYKADNGKYPQSLDALAPKYLQKAPDDFCSGKSFIYKTTGQGYVLYSVGENMKDDGGKTKAEGGDDLVVKTPSPAATQP